MKLNTNTQHFTPTQLAQELHDNHRVVAYFNGKRTTIVQSLDTLFVIKGLSQVDYLDIDRCVQQIPAKLIGEHRNILDVDQTATYIDMYATFALENDLPF